MVRLLGSFKKMDASGRYVIPAHFRKEFGIDIGKELELCLIEEDGEYYLGFKVNPSETYLAQLKRFSSTQ